jgi:hypothetical protein
MRVRRRRSRAIAETRLLGAARELNRGGAFQFFFATRLGIPFSALAGRIQSDANPEYTCFYGLPPRSDAGELIAVCDDLIGRGELDERIVGNELRANLVYLRDSLLAPHGKK